MFDKESIEALQQGAAIEQANCAIEDSTGRTEQAHALFALPEGFKVHDLEHVLELRRRARGVMTTNSVKSFADYTKKHAEAGANVFVDKAAMKATAVLNLGTPDKPGQTDNRAVLALEKTAPFEALLAIANGRARTQTEIAEFLEDWEPFITCKSNGEDLATSVAAHSVRNITIEGMRKAQSTEEQLSASRSTFEAVQATSATKLPTQIAMVIDQPYTGLAPRNFTMRVSVVTTDKPGLILRLIRLEDAYEQMAEEFAGIVDEALAGEIPVLLGTYQCTR